MCSPFMRAVRSADGHNIIDGSGDWYEISHKTRLLSIGKKVYTNRYMRFIYFLIERIFAVNIAPLYIVVI